MAMLLDTHPASEESDTPKKSDIRIAHSRSDTSIFFQSEPIFLGEVDSHYNESLNISTENDWNRVLSQAAFLVRFINLTLDVKTFCLPVFWVGDTGNVKIALVFQSQNSNVVCLVIYPLNSAETVLNRSFTIHCDGRDHFSIGKAIGDRPTLCSDS